MTLPSGELRLCNACRRVRPAQTLCPGCGGALALAGPEFFVGSSAGKYRIEGVLGVGGMGIVYRATHTLLGRAAAVKFVLPQGGDDDFARRFLREAQVLAHLRHPHIVEVYDFDTTEWELPFYVMELLEGATLRQRLAGAGPDQDLKRFGRFLREAGEGLAHAHASGVVHRDLKPENIFIARIAGADTVKLLDFGIAKVLRTGAEATGLTQTGVVMGTPNYMAPEQVVNRNVGPHTDQYALALILAEVATGRALRAGRTLGEILAEDVNRPVPANLLDVPGIPSFLRDAIQRATHPEPERRFPSVRELFAAIAWPLESAPDVPAYATPTVGPAAGVRTPGGTHQDPTALTPGRGSASVHDAPTSATPAPSVVAAAPPAARRPFWRRILGIAALAVLVLVGRTIQHKVKARMRQNRAERMETRAAKDALDPAHPERALSLRRSVPAPADLRKILSLKRDMVILEGDRAVYLAPWDGAPATRVPLGENEFVAGADLDGDVLLVRDGVLLRKEFDSGNERPVAQPIPPASGYVLSPQGRYLVSQHENGLRFHWIHENTARETGRVEVAPQHLRHLGVGLGMALVVHDGRTEAWSLLDGTLLAALDKEDLGTFASAFHAERKLVAWAGNMDHIALWDVGTGALQSLPVKGEVTALAFLPDHPTLIASTTEGSWIWRPGQDAPVPWPGDARAYSRLCVQGGGILAADPRRRMVDLWDYRSALQDGPTRHAGTADLWTVLWDGPRQRLFAGGESPELFELDDKAGKSGSEARKHAVHNQGITSMVSDGEFLATASDDRTIAVWKLADMSVRWRSRSHEYLVNHLALQGSPPALWSVSSDGLVKRWGWPDLEETGSWNPGELLGRKNLSLACVWPAPDLKTVLLGTWNDTLVVLHLEDPEQPRVEEFPVDARAVYSVCPVVGQDAVLLVGTHRRSALHVYDLQRHALIQLEDFGLSLTACAAEPGQPVAWVTGDGCLIRVALRRDAQRALVAEQSVRLNTSFGMLAAAAFTDEARPRLVLGGSGGAVRFADTDVFGKPAGP